MSSNKVYDVIIVGGGPAGITAGIYAMRAALKSVIIEKGVAGGQVAITDNVENYPGFENITGYELSQKFLQHVQSYGIEFLQKEVVAVEPGMEFHAVRLDGGEVLRAHAVILAVGGSPKKLNVPGEAENYGKGVSYCATCDGFFFRGKTVAVVGGGDTAMEEALYLAKLAEKVYVIHRRDALRASRILQQRVMKECKIEIIWNSVVAAIKSDEQGVCGVTLQDTKTSEQRDLKTDGVFVFIGFSPNNHLVPAGVKVDAQGYVMTDDKCETNIPGLFVAGDLRRKYARQIVLATSDGCIAALAAAQHVESRKGASESCAIPEAKA